MITNKFKELIATAINGSGFTAPTYTAWGDDGTDETVNDTSLGNELLRDGKESSIRQNNVVEILGSLGTSELVGETIREAGLFDAASDGNMCIRGTFADIEKTNQFEIESIYIISVN